MGLWVDSKCWFPGYQSREKDNYDGIWLVAAGPNRTVYSHFKLPPAFSLRGGFISYHGYCAAIASLFKVPFKFII